MARFNDIDRRVLQSITGRDRIKALLRERSLSLKEFAAKHNQWVSDVSRCIGGERPFPEIRDALAAELDLPRDQVDRIIDDQ